VNDNLLTYVDQRRMGTEEPLTVEGALFAGISPLKDLPEKDARKHFRLLRLAREYLVDFDLPRACARADIDWDLVKGAERDKLFITLVRGLMEEMKPEDVISRAEILNMLKREATTASKATDRINAMNHLARLAGMELQQEDKSGRNATPVINLTLAVNQGTAVQVLPSAEQEKLL
jgi:hypothetical protein